MSTTPTSMTVDEALAAEQIKIIESKESLVVGQRTSQQIVDQTNTLAHKLYNLQGYEASEDFKFYTARRSRERTAWWAACLAQIELTETDPEDALSDLDEPDQTIDFVAKCMARAMPNFSPVKKG